MDSDAIKELQEALRAIAFYDPRYSLPSVNGIFDAETETAVRIYQQIHDLPTTGIVDTDLYDEIINNSQNLQGSILSPLQVFSRSTKLSILPGTSHPALLFIKPMINTIAESYINIPNVTINTSYDSATEQAIQKILALNNTSAPSVIDNRLWNILVQFYQAIPDRGEQL